MVKRVKKCLNCGKEIPKYKRNKFYCSESCHQEYIKKEKRREIIENNGEGVYFRQIKKYLLEIRGHKCEICGRVSWMGKPIPLILDHINGHANNNSLDNVRLVCANCDAQLPTYKSKNKNSDRVYRKKYYRRKK